MNKLFKKFLVYLIMSIMILPTWLISDMSKAEHAKAAVSGDNLVISEVAVNIGGASNEFVELYNPTNALMTINDSNFVLKFVNGSDTVSKRTLTWTKHDILPGGYFLIASSVYGVVADATFTAALPEQGGVIIEAVNGAISVVADSVVWGTTLGLITTHAETKAIDYNIAPNNSVERYYNNNVGNYLDTDNNSTDFYSQVTPNPQNSTSVAVFKSIKDATKVELASGSKTVMKKNEAISLDIKVTYPGIVSSADPAYLADAIISADKTIPVGTMFDLYYNSTNLGTGVFAVPLVPTVGIYLSDVIKGINPILPTRTPLNMQAGSSTWGLIFSNLPDDNYNFGFDAVSGKQFTDLKQVYILGSLEVPVTVDTSVVAPSNVVATRKGTGVDLTWNAVTDSISGLAGYNVYSSADNFVTPVNATILLDNKFSIDTLVDGEYTFSVVAVDKAGNTAETRSNKIGISSAALTAPVITVTNLSSDGGRYIHIEWQGVGNYANRYDVYVNGVLSTVSYVDAISINDKNVTYKKDIKVSVDGSYDVYVKVWKDATSLSSAVKSVSFVTAPVVEEVIPVVSVAAPRAYAAPVTEKKIETPADDSNGQIKGDESATEDDTNNINWTPWIVLFILIILAGAATGGYFYWFSGEEEIETVVHAPKKVVKEEKVIPVVVAPKKVSKGSGGSKKTKRW